MQEKQDKNIFKITRGEESKLTSWYFEIDRSLLGLVLMLVVIGVITMITAGAADATRMGYPWYHFIKSAFIPYTLGLVCLFGFSMLNKKQIIQISVIGLIVGILTLLLTVIPNPAQVIKNGSHRWVNIAGQMFMPADVLKPFFIVVTAWFLALMRKTYGSDIFFNKEAWKFNKISWIPYLTVFLICVLLILLHPDLGTALLYIGVFGVMLFVAEFPLKWLPGILGGVGGLGALAIAFLPQMAHVRERIGHIFYVEPRSQAWYSLNAVKHGGLLGSGEESFVKDVLPEATNDFVYASIAEDWGAIGCIALLLLLLVVLNKLITHAIHARDDFVIYAISGVAALFGIQICFNLMTALHLLIDKGMTLPFISYGGVSFVTFCITFGMILSLIHEDTWNK